VTGYYVRIAPSDVLRDPAALRSELYIKNRGSRGRVTADEEVGVDFLQLVRFGLRSADDDRIRDSVKVADAILKTDTSVGPVWHRYNGDGYGEHDDGGPFDGNGIGRGWPLLTGERGHYELMAGNDPLPYLKAMAAMTGPCGMMPEQVWDSEPLPAMRLFPGKPSGSAMPLAWAHAEFIKLMVSRHLGYPFDRPAAAWRRYGGRRRETKQAIWRLNAPIGRIARGATLVVALPRGAHVRWGVDGWQSIADGETKDTGLGLHALEIDFSSFVKSHRIDFTFQWCDTHEWAGADFHIDVDD
jgi:glucoamylase